MTRSPGDFSAFDTISIGLDEIVYAFVALDRAPTTNEFELLDVGERDRATRFVHEADRRRFTMSHAALRTMLARCLDRDPAEIRYETGPQGKPRLAKELDPLEFNMAHSHELALMAVTRQGALGVDLEQLEEVPDAIELADSHFSERERRALRTVSEAERAERFLRYWTRKEAVIKASGEGLSRALRDFDVDTAPRVVSIPGADGSPERWVLADLPAPAGYLAAGAVASAGQTPGWRAL